MNEAIHRGGMEKTPENWLRRWACDKFDVHYEMLDLTWLSTVRIKEILAI